MYMSFAGCVHPLQTSHCDTPSETKITTSFSFVNAEISNVSEPTEATDTVFASPVVFLIPIKMLGLAAASGNVTAKLAPDVSQRMKSQTAAETALFAVTTYKFMTLPVPPPPVISGL